MKIEGNGMAKKGIDFDLFAMLLALRGKPTT